jgi:two-component system sensor histidine kinase UhpB
LKLDESSKTDNAVSGFAKSVPLEKLTISLKIEFTEGRRIGMPSARLPWRISPDAPIALTAALVCILCYLGSTLDMAVSYPRIKTAILFPPYAILTTALLVTPVRHWWIYLLASSIGNYFPHRGGMPVSWVLMAEGANYIRALVAAGGIRYSLRAPGFGTLREVVVFLSFAVVLAPCTAAFAGASIVTLHLLSKGVEDYWLIWQAWFLSNAVTGLTLLPIIVISIRDAGAWKRNASLRNSLELTVLLAGLLAIGVLVFATPYGGGNALPAQLFAPLPFLLWAAVRFGPGGTSGGLLVITIVTIWGALHEQGPFVTQMPTENLLSLQLFLLAISLPLMVLAAVMGELQRTAASLRQEIADREDVEAALRGSYAQVQDLAGRLITAQEAERARIARELHDDINQQLASLSIALCRLKRRLPKDARKMSDELGSVQGRTVELVNAVRQISHDLHPGVLQHAGLQAALEARCAEFRKQQDTRVVFQAHGDLTGIPQEVSLCLYRVAQEALGNIARHAHACAIDVSLTRTDGDVQLEIVDDGQGFDLAEARRSGGLGLLDMEERVRLVMGSVSIDTHPQGGTHLRAEVPLRGPDYATLESTTRG